MRDVEDSCGSEISVSTISTITEDFSNTISNVVNNHILSSMFSPLTHLLQPHSSVGGGNLPLMMNENSISTRTRSIYLCNL